MHCLPLTFSCRVSVAESPFTQDIAANHACKQLSHVVCLVMPHRAVPVSTLRYPELLMLLAGRSATCSQRESEHHQVLGFRASVQEQLDNTPHGRRQGRL